LLDSVEKQAREVQEKAHMSHLNISRGTKCGQGGRINSYHFSWRNCIFYCNLWQKSNSVQRCSTTF